MKCVDLHNDIRSEGDAARSLRNLVLGNGREGAYGLYLNLNTSLLFVIYRALSVDLQRGYVGFNIAILVSTTQDQPVALGPIMNTLYIPGRGVARGLILYD